MYMDLRYEGAGSDRFSNAKALNTGEQPAVMSTLLTWHFQDTVDQLSLIEILTNLQEQKPFIDHGVVITSSDSIGVVWNPFLDVEKMDDVRSMVNIHQILHLMNSLTTSFAGRASLNVKGQDEFNGKA